MTDSLTTMSKAPESFSQTVTRLFEMARENIATDGFSTEMLLGFDASAHIVVTFVSAAGMERDRLAAQVPEGTRVVSRPLLAADSLLAAGFALHDVRAAVFTGVIDLGGEPHLVATGVWPGEAFAASLAVPLALADLDGAVRPTHDLDPSVARDLTAVEHWAATLVPETPLADPIPDYAILAS